MKNIIKLSSVLTAALCVISCNEKMGLEFEEPGDYITVSTYVAAHTKVGYEGTSVLPDNFFISIDQNGTANDYEKTMSRMESSNKYMFPNNEKLKWVSSDYSTVNIKAITTPSCYNMGDGKIILSQNQSTEAAVLSNDLLGAQTDAGIEVNSGNIIVHFNHLMSKLYVKYNTPSSTTISSITVSNMCYDGNFDFTTMTHGASGNVGTITMYHDADNNTAEAIFCPYEPSSNLKPSLTITGKKSNGYNSSINLNTPISLDKIGGKFLPGKRYIMNVTITDTSIEGAEVTVSEWIPDITTITTPGENVLWVGTSIPAGNEAHNYPKEVDKAMTCRITNVAVGGSLVCPQLNADWITENHYKNYNEATGTVKLSMKLMGGGLSQTKNDITTLYEKKLLDVSGQDRSWTDEVLREMQSLSYESKIIPYIDGTISSAEGGNCTTVIIDHGFNDLSNMIYIAGVFQTSGEHVRGYECLRKMRDKEKTIAEFEEEIRNNKNNVSLRASYIHAMAKIIEAIKNTNSDVRIIIGNYFSLYSPYVARQYQIQHESEYLYNLSEDSNGNPILTRRKDTNRRDVANPAYKQFPDYATFSNLICYYNEAIAGIFDLDIINVYEHISIPETTFWGGTQNYTVNGKVVTCSDFSIVDFDASFNPIVLSNSGKFCPDGVHPSNPAAIGAIAEVYIDHLDGIVGSRGRDNTPTTSSTTAGTAVGMASWDEELDVL